MPPNRSKASQAGLGKTLINRRVKEALAPKESGLYVLDDNNPLASVTHERDLDEFLANAALAEADFTTERTKMRIVAGIGADNTKNPFLLSEQEEKEVVKKQRDLSHGLTVPRRPAWTRSTTRQELERQERESFLDWRRDLAKLAESSSLLMTPFERNVQLWRQLWRVLERSHLVVQIVDARNPLGFRCVDLDKYVHEIGEDKPDAAVPGKGKRRSLLLINKADLLTVEQRTAWADHFDSLGVTYAFFSAANAAAAQEQAERQRRRAEGLGEETESEDEDDAGVEDEDRSVSGEEVEPLSDEQDEEEDDVADVSKAVDDVDLSDDEEGWSTEGEDEREAAGTAPRAEKRLAQGETVPLSAVAREIASEAEESRRTRVLSVTELEDLFLTSAPPLSDFATARDPSPEKLVVGLVGYPNVGKSSTINALLGSKKVSVSATPGKTKHFQTLMLSDDVTLCDCPGLVFPQFANTQADMVVDGILPIDQMREFSAPVELVCQRVPREIIEGTYGIRIDVREEEDGGTGKVGWEEMLSAYAIARGMTRSSFGMPDTSRAARYVLKDYVNARLLFAHPPPGITPDDFMQSSREQTLERLEAEFQAGRKRAPATHVSKNADTFIAPASGAGAGAGRDVEDAGEVDPEADPASGPSAVPGTGASAETVERSRQATSRQVKSTAASAPARSGRQKAAALDDVYFTETGPAPRPVIKGRKQAAMAAEQTEGAGAEGAAGMGYSRNTAYPHQRMLGPDGMPIVRAQGDGGGQGQGQGQGAGWGVMGRGKKSHFKVKEGKKRSGKGYD